MTVYLGAATFNQQGDSLVVQPPVGFNTAEAIRMANYTVDIIVLKNIGGNNVSDTQYLPPATQMVYPIKSFQQNPTFFGIQLGPDLPNEQVLVEWSDDPLEDFQGTYPYALPLNPDSFATGNLAYDLRVDVSGGVATMKFHGTNGFSTPPTITSSILTIPVTTTRLSATIQNEGSTFLNYSGAGGFGAGAYTKLFPGAPTATLPTPGGSMSINNGSQIEIHADFTNNGTALSIFGEASS